MNLIANLFGRHLVVDRIVSERQRSDCDLNPFLRASSICTHGPYSFKNFCICFSMLTHHCNSLPMSACIMVDVAHASICLQMLATALRKIFELTLTEYLPTHLNDNPKKNKTNQNFLVPYYLPTHRAAEHQSHFHCNVSPSPIFLLIQCNLEACG